MYIWIEFRKIESEWFAVEEFGCEWSVAPWKRSANYASKCLLFIKSVVLWLWNETDFCLQNTWPNDFVLENGWYCFRFLNWPTYKIGGWCCLVAGFVNMGVGRSFDVRIHSNELHELTSCDQSDSFTSKFVYARGCIWLQLNNITVCVTALS